MDMGYYGEEGRPLLPAEIEAEIEKAWSPAASPYDSEGRRHKRGEGYTDAALVGAGAGAAVAGHQGFKAVEAARKLKGDTPLRELAGKKGVLRPTGRAAAGVGGLAAGVAAHHAIKRKRKGSWQSYG